MFTHPGIHGTVASGSPASGGSMLAEDAPPLALELPPTLVDAARLVELTPGSELLLGALEGARLELDGVRDEETTRLEEDTTTNEELMSTEDDEGVRLELTPGSDEDEPISEEDTPGSDDEAISPLLLDCAVAVPAVAHRVRLSSTRKRVGVIGS